jgi:hypothetical protein
MAGAIAKNLIPMLRMRNHPLLIKIFHWEYWPFHVVYAPVYLYWIWLCVKARSFFFFSAANPSIVNGGFLMERKHDIYPLIPEGYYPRTLFFPTGEPAAAIMQQVSEQSMKWPLIAKPDIGMRGLGVCKLDSPDALRKYAEETAVDYLIQEYIPYEEEAGIFYCRMPGSKKGFISGIVGKQLLSVTGDGFSTIESLIKKEARSLLQLPVLQKEMPDVLREVPAPGETRIIVPYGNHARGACFIDISHLTDDMLTDSIDAICSRISGFFYGRLDIRYRSWEALRRGEEFSIIELNGAGSEPTHIYDPHHSLFFAWKEIIRHWNLLYRISKANHQISRIPYLSLQAGIQMFRDNRQYLRKLR